MFFVYFPLLSTSVYLFPARGGLKGSQILGCLIIGAAPVDLNANFPSCRNFVKYNRRSRALGSSYQVYSTMDVCCTVHTCIHTVVYICTLIKNKIKFSSYIRNFRMEQLQSHNGQRPPYIWWNICAFPHILESLPLYIYDYAHNPIWISFYMRKILFSFISVYMHAYIVYICTYAEHFATLLLHAKNTRV
jgi:hypothetical protein